MSDVIKVLILDSPIITKLINLGGRKLLDEAVKGYDKVFISPELLYEVAAGNDVDLIKIYTEWNQDLIDNGRVVTNYGDGISNISAINDADRVKYNPTNKGGLNGEKVDISIRKYLDSFSDTDTSNIKFTVVSTDNGLLSNKYNLKNIPHNFVNTDYEKYTYEVIIKDFIAKKILTIEQYRTLLEKDINGIPKYLGNTSDLYIIDKNLPEEEVYKAYIDDQKIKSGDNFIHNDRIYKFSIVSALLDNMSYGLKHAGFIGDIYSAYTTYKIAEGYYEAGDIENGNRSLTEATFEFLGGVVGGAAALVAGTTLLMLAGSTAPVAIAAIGINLAAGYLMGEVGKEISDRLHEDYPDEIRNIYEKIKLISENIIDMLKYSSNPILLLTKILHDNGIFGINGPLFGDDGIFNYIKKIYGDGGVFSSLNLDIDGILIVSNSTFGSLIGTEENDILISNNSISGFLRDSDNLAISTILGGDGNDKMISYNDEGARFFGGDGNDSIVIWKANYKQITNSNGDMQHLYVEAHGENGDDRITKFSGDHAIIVGGRGKDIINAGNATIWAGEKPESDSQQAVSDDDQDSLHVSNGAHVFGAGVEDRAYFGAMRLTGGIELSWQETGYAHWSPGFSALAMVAPILSAPILSLGIVLDVVAGFALRYGATQSGQLFAEFWGGRGGRVVFENYKFDFKTGEGTAGIAVFSLRPTVEVGFSLERLGQTANAIFSQAWGATFKNGTDPLVLDLDGDGLEVGRYTAQFDMDADGFAELTDWAYGGDGFLARDLNNDGVINDISELFGNASTPGFSALGALDDNADGIIDANDAAWSELRIWVDADLDGVTDDGELTDLASHGIASIDVGGAVAVTGEDVRDNEIRARSTFLRADGSTGAIADVALNTDQTASRWLGDATISAAAAALPNLHGFGDVKDLAVAATADATLLGLLSEFTELSASSDWGTLVEATEEVFLRWTGADAAPATNFGHGANAEKLLALEAWVGIELAPRDADGAPVVTAATAREISAQWDLTIERLAVRLAAQGPLAQHFPDVSYDAGKDLLAFEGPATLKGVVAAFIAALPADPAAAAIQWAGHWGPLLERLTENAARSDGNRVADDYLITAVKAAHDSVAPSLGLATLLSAVGLDAAPLIAAANGGELGRAGSGLRVFVSNGGNDTFVGGGGQSVYVFGSSFGADVIRDGESREQGDRIRFTELNVEDLSFKRVGNDLVIAKISAPANKITIVNQFVAPTRSMDGSIISLNWGVEEIQFADGEIWDFTDIAQAVGRGTSASETITGSGQDDWIEGREGNDVLNGGDGGDSYFYSAGHGSDTIFDDQQNPLSPMQDALIFETGISFDDIVFERSLALDPSRPIESDRGEDNLVIRFKTSNDTITIKNQFGYTSLGVKGGDSAGGAVGSLFGSIGGGARLALDNRIETFVFQDGPPLSWKEVEQRLIAQATTEDNDLIYGFGSGDVFAASAGDDKMVGLDGGDAYHFGRGSGHDLVHDQARYITLTAGDKVVFDAGIAPEDLIFSRPGSAPDLLVTIADTGETLMIRDQFAGFRADLFGLLGVNWFSKIETFVFADGQSALSWQDVLAIITTGGDGDDALYGDHYADTLRGGAGNDYMSGRDDGDVYIISADGGHDVIQDRQQDLTTTAPDILRFDASIVFGDVTFSRDIQTPNDLLVSFADGGGVTIRNHYVVTETGPFGAQAFDRIERFQWADGTIRTWSEIEAAIIAASATDGDDTILGTHFDNLLVGGAGDDVLIGGDGSDVYHVEAGDGADVIREGMDNLLAPSQDMLRFGASLSPDDASYAREGDDLIISFWDENGEATGDSVRVAGQWSFFDTGPFGVQNFNLVETVHFEATGESLSWRTIMGKILLAAKTDGDDVVTGFYFDDVIDGGAGNDLLIGGDGSDTYIFDVGYGHDVIRENRTNIFSGALDKVVFGASILPTDLTITRLGERSLLFTLDANTSLKIEGAFNEAPIAEGLQYVEEYHFADGTIWTMSDIRARLLAATDGDDVLMGFSGSQRLDGGAGDDLLDGRSGADTYVFGPGYGHDVIAESQFYVGDNRGDRVSFTAGLRPSDISVAVGSSTADLVVTILATGETLTIRNQFGLWFWAIEEFFFTYEENGQTKTETWSQARIAAEAMGSAGTLGDDVINGTNLADTLEGGRGNDTLRGHVGDDLYIFNPGDGADVVDDNPGNSTFGGKDTIKFVGRASTDFRVERVGGDGQGVVFIDVASGDSVTVLRGGMPQEFFRIETYIFEDVTLHTRTDGAFEIYAAAASSTDGNDTIYGFDGWNDVIRAGRGDDKLIGLGGDDLYLFDLDSGFDTLIDSSGSADKVRFGSGVTPGMVRMSAVQQNGSENLKLEIVVDSSIADPTNGTPGATTTIAALTIQDQLKHNAMGVEAVEFADGTVWSAAEIRGMLIEQMNTEGNDVITGFWGAEILYSIGGDDLLRGGAGGDTYLFGRGFGHDIVEDSHVVTQDGAPDTVRFNAGLAPKDFEIQRHSNGRDVIFHILDEAGARTSDSLTIRYAFNPPGPMGVYSDTWNGVERYEFGDGSIWTKKELRDHLLARARSDGDDHIVGFAFGELLDGGAGNDLLEGGAGGDTYRFGYGYGEDTALDSHVTTDGGTDVVHFIGVSSSNVQISRVGDWNLMFRLLDENGAPTGDSLTSVNSFATQNWLRIEEYRFDDGAIWRWDQISQIAMEKAGSNGVDVIRGFNGADVINARAGDDVINGGAGNDVIDGGAGNDRLNGEAGDDRLTGGAGSDVFIIGAGSGSDVITDFTIGEDRLRFEGFTQQASLAAIAALSGSNPVLALPGGVNVHLQGLEAEQFRFEDVDFDWLNFRIQSGEVETDRFGYDVPDASGALLRTERDGDVVAFFTSDGTDAQLRFRGYDVDSNNEIRILVNGVLVQALAMGVNNGFSVYEVDIPASAQSSGLNILTFKQTGAVTERWGVADIELEQGLDFSGQGVDNPLIASLVTPIVKGTSGNDALVGTNAAEAFDGRGGADSLRGGAGSDIYIWGVGRGNDLIIEDSLVAADVDRVALDGLNVSDVVLSRAGNNLVVTALASGETLTVRDHFNGARYGVESLVFANGQTMDRAQIVTAAWLRGGVGDDTLIGSANSETLDGGAGNDTLQGGEGSDTYVWGAGRGNDLIIENSLVAADVDRVAFDGLNVSDVVLSRAGNNLIVTALASGETLTVRDHFNGARYGVESLVFANGQTMDRAQIVTAAWLRGGVGNDTLTGSANSETLDGGAGNDTLQGGQGSDTYVWGVGRGNDLIIEDSTISTDIDMVALDGLNVSDVVLSRAGNNLIVTALASGETLTVRDHFTSERYGIERMSFANDLAMNRNDILLETQITAARQKATPGNDTITGAAGADVLIGGLGDDMLHGLAGGDLYLFVAGEGVDTIQDKGNSSGTDILKISGHASTDALASRVGSDGLRLDFVNGDAIIILNTLDQDPADQIERIEFMDDDVVWTPTYVNEYLL